ncbi:MAG TPA: universal stress protein [Methanocella sp.]|uniref:universal stress protein n=1 Tax=Methanocella sp. TaxID=2052833 RepID=UPI002BA59C85|nr:universal stress protein [Methanocella sp.]HTY90680.1 universal stress protein [Methanocella sp.]
MSDLFNKILIATDGSQYSLAAMQKGIDLARLYESKVYALYVIDTRVLAGTGGMPEPENIYQLLELEGKNAVGQVKKAAEGLQVETFVLPGHPTETIARFAKDNGVDLIVMGTLGKSNIEEMLLGSIADSVIRISPCPVLIVRGTV